MPTMMQYYIPWPCRAHRPHPSCSQYDGRIHIAIRTPRMIHVFQVPAFSRNKRRRAARRGPAEGRGEVRGESGGAVLEYFLHLTHSKQGIALNYRSGLQRRPRRGPQAAPLVFAVHAVQGGTWAPSPPLNRPAPLFARQISRSASSYATSCSANILVLTRWRKTDLLCWIISHHAVLGPHYPRTGTRGIPDAMIWSQKWLYSDYRRVPRDHRGLAPTMR